MNGKPDFYLVCGKSGVGKSTFSKKFTEKMGIEYIETDAYYAKVNGSELDRSHKFEVWIEIYKEIHRNEEAGKSVLLDTNGLTLADRIDYVNWFEEFDHHIIWIGAPDNLRRSNNRSRTRVVPEDVMDRMNNIASVPTLDSEDERWKSITWISNTNNNFIFGGTYGMPSIELMQCITSVVKR